MLCLLQENIDRKALLTKLIHFGIADQMRRAIFSVLKYNVRILDGNQLSGRISTDLGVPQGNKLSELSFSLFLADLSTLISITDIKNLFLCRGLGN